MFGSSRRSTTAPSISSRTMSACPACRAVSIPMCTRIWPASRGAPPHLAGVQGEGVDRRVAALRRVAAELDDLRPRLVGRRPLALISASSASQGTSGWWRADRTRPKYSNSTPATCLTSPSRLVPVEVVQPADLVLAQPVGLRQQAGALRAQVPVEGLLLVHRATMPPARWCRAQWIGSGGGRPRDPALRRPPNEVVDITVPATVERPALVVLLHGGFWRVAYDRQHLREVADAALGYAVANVEYRRVGGGGGWPTTFTDVADDVDAIGSRSPAGSTSTASRTWGTRPAVTWPSGRRCGTEPWAPGGRTGCLGRAAGGPGTGRRPGRRARTGPEPRRRRGPACSAVTRAPSRTGTRPPTPQRSAHRRPRPSWCTACSTISCPSRSRGLPRPHRGRAGRGARRRPLRVVDPGSQAWRPRSMGSATYRRAAASGLRTVCRGPGPRWWQRHPQPTGSTMSTTAQTSMSDLFETARRRARRGVSTRVLAATPRAMRCSPSTGPHARRHAQPLISRRHLDVRLVAHRTSSPRRRRTPRVARAAGGHGLAAGRRRHRHATERRSRVAGGAVEVLTDVDSAAHTAPLACSRSRSDAVGPTPPNRHGGGVSWEQLGSHAHRAGGVQPAPVPAPGPGDRRRQPTSACSAPRGGGRRRRRGRPLRPALPAAMFGSGCSRALGVGRMLARHRARGRRRVEFDRRKPPRCASPAPGTSTSSWPTSACTTCPTGVLAAMWSMAREEGTCLSWTSDPPRPSPPRATARTPPVCILPACRTAALAGRRRDRGPDVLAGYAQAAGFAGVEVLPVEHEMFRFYRRAAECPPTRDEPGVTPRPPPARSRRARRAAAGRSRARGRRRGRGPAGAPHRVAFGCCVSSDTADLVLGPQAGRAGRPERDAAGQPAPGRSRRPRR